jgi:uncharacterized protein YjbI with pentapeptide repeats
MSEQDGTQKTALQRPITNDEEAWKGYWNLQGQSWRLQPEIETERQKYLAEHRNIIPDIEHGIYPFKGIKLNRADVEWLLATHENGRGPVDRSKESEWARAGLDLRGADLRGTDLTNLPLAKMVGGLVGHEWPAATEKQRDMAAVHMEGAKLLATHLEGARLRFAHLENANLKFTHLEGTHLRGAYLVGADLREAYMYRVRLENAVLSDEKHIGPRLADAHLEGVNLAVVNWKEVEALGDENEALQKKGDGKVKDNRTWLADYEVAVRANRQLAVALQEQGLNEDAACFAYRAQRLQRVVLRRQRKFGSYLFSLFLDLLAGYGYRPGRSVFWYLVIIAGFATAYYTFGHISPLEAFILSLTSFHGRGFFPGINITLSDPRVVLAAFEAVIGLFIEISFIATFTKRFFGS